MDGQEDISGITTFRPSPTKLCYSGTTKSEDGDVMLNGLYGFNPAEGCWMDLIFIKLEDSDIFAVALLRTDVDKPLRTGSTVSLEATESSNGETVKYTATRVYKTVQKDKIIFVNQDKKTADGASLPDTTLILERKVK